MRIKFGNAEYKLSDPHVNVSVDHFQCLIEKDDSTIDKIVDDVKNADEITTIDDEGEVTGVYHGYTEIISIYTYDGLLVNVELYNKDLVTQVEKLSVAVEKMEDLQKNQEQMIEQVAVVATSLSNSQVVQDHAIEDLAEVVSDIAPQEG